MKLAQSVRVGAWLLIGLNLLMAFGSIWIFMRMAPAIAVIIEQNERSLLACEEMLASLALVNADSTTNAALQERFTQALKRADNNITEAGESAALKSINSHYEDAFVGIQIARERTVTAITLLGEINRQAMVQADQRAQKLGSAGAWGVVFMAVCVFFGGVVFKRSLSRNLIKPLEEIHRVIGAHRAGNLFRRCSENNVPRDVRAVLNGVNELLDMCSWGGQKKSGV